MAAIEHRPPLPRRRAVKIQLLLIALLLVAWHGPAQTNRTTEPNLNDLAAAVQEWAEENLDDDFLAALGEVDQQRVEAFLSQFARQLGGERVLDLAALKDAAKAILPLLDAHEETQPYAAWLRARMDYLDAAEEMRRAQPPPKLMPGQPPPPPTNPPPVLERKVWEKKLSQRPLPKGADSLVPQLKGVFTARRVPPELIWLAEVESSFDRRAKSPAGAAGLFQLMPETAIRFGLRRWPFDQRYQVEPSAQAAADYLKALHKRFRDWPLAVAAYNAGEGRVGKLLEKHHARSFDAIAPHLPAETQMYVPRVEATVFRREGIRLSRLATPGG